MIEQESFAFLFEGQGKQYPGMYNFLIDAHEESRRIFDRADLLCKRNNLDFRISDVCLEEDPEKSLLAGNNFNPVATQLALLTGETATVNYLHAMGVPRASLNGGHSYGQWPGVVESGFLSFDDVFKLTIVRGNAMEQVDKAKASAVGLIYDARRIEESLITLVKERLASHIEQEDDDGEITVQNHAHQLLIGGSKKHVERVIGSLQLSHPHLMANIQENIQLSHHRRLRGAQAIVSGALETMKAFNEIAIVPMLGDVNHTISETFTQLKQAMGTHLDHDLIFEACMLIMSQRGIQKVLEIGPGKIFGGMFKLANINVKVSTTESMTALDNVIANYAIR